jgi:hypothetical protein
MKFRFTFLAASFCLVACGDDDPIVSSDSGTDTGAGDVGADTPEPDVIPDAILDVTADADVEPDLEPDVPTGPTIETVHANIFADSCGGGFCHLSGQEAGGLSLDLSEGLMAALMGPSSASGVNTIEAGDPSSSYLYLKSSGEFGAVGGSGGLMPLGAPPLTDDQLQMLADWITNL